MSKKSHIGYAAKRSVREAVLKLCRISQKGKSSFAAAIEQDLIFLLCDKFFIIKW